MHRSAVLAFPDDQGEPQCRLVLERIAYPLDWAEATIYETAPRRPPRTAAWLMCNPSIADALQDDPTAGRVVHHSARVDCPRSLVGNIWPVRTPYPADLWRSLQQSADGRLPADWEAANLDALCMIGAQADFHMVAFGVAPMRDYPLSTKRALEAFSCNGRFPLYCLGVASGGEPLHPLARGKFAVRNDAKVRPWTGWKPPGANERSWDDVMADKRRVNGGWVDR